MPEDTRRIAGVRFRNAGKLTYFDAAGMRLEAGEYVVVETSRGPELGRVVVSPDQVVVNELEDEDLPPILRLATEDDLERMDGLRSRAHELLPEARALAGELGLDARIDSADFTLDGRRLSFSFSSEGRIDYRDFVRRAAERFGARIDMRQVGARDRAKLAGGYGICGRELCCSNWLATFPSISIRMAKDQELPLNPQKISGLCGRLLCCLSYEEEGYREMRKTLPRIGQRCSTPTGEGRVVAVNILRRQVTLMVDGQRLEVGDRDLGLVVRWDSSSKTAEPPPSLTRQEGVALGLIEVGDEELEALSEPMVPEGRGRLPAGGPRRTTRRRPEPAPAKPEGPPLPRPGGPRVERVFRRRDAGPASDSQPPERRPRPPRRARGGRNRGPRPG